MGVPLFPLTRSVATNGWSHRTQTSDSHYSRNCYRDVTIAVLPMTVKVALVSSNRPFFINTLLNRSLLPSSENGGNQQNTRQTCGIQSRFWSLSTIWLNHTWSQKTEAKLVILLAGRRSQSLFIILDRRGFGLAPE